MSNETQNTIGDWVVATLNPDPIIQAKKLQDEVKEFCLAIEAGKMEHAAEELADVAIVVFGLASLLGVRILQRINWKMAINRQRNWKVTEDGTHQHV